MSICFLNKGLQFCIFLGDANLVKNKTEQNNTPVAPTGKASALLV